MSAHGQLPSPPFSSASNAASLPVKASPPPAELLARIAQASPQGLLVEEMGQGEGRIVYTNPAFSHLTGYLPAEITGQTLAGLLRPAVSTPGWADWEQRPSEESLRLACVSARRKDGTLFYIEIEVYPLEETSPQSPVHRVLGIRDVTAQVDLQKALIRNEAYHRLLAENIHDLVTVHRPDGTCLYASPSCREMLGYEPVELLYQPMSRFVDDDFLADGERLLAGGPPGVFTHRLRRKDGSRIWAETTGKTRRSPEGTGQEVVSTLRNISRRKAAEDKVVAMHEVLSAVYEAVPAGLCLVDIQGSIQLCNEAFARLFAAPIEEVCGRPVTAFLSTRLWTRAVSAPSSVHLGDCLALDGREFPVELVLSRVETSQSNWQLLTLQDVTERRRLETRVREARQLESLGTLAGGVAHDFNNMLSIILGYGSLLRDYAGNPARLEECAGRIIEAAQRGADVVRQLQVFANVHEFEAMPVNVHELISEVLAHTTKDWPESIRLRLDLRAVHVTLPIDAPQLSLALQHLLQNASDALVDSTGSIIVRSAETAPAAGDQPSTLILSVEDTGRGMDALTRGRIFEPFFAKDKGPQVRGLGLAVVYGIVRAHGGHIEVGSEPGKGTQVRVFLPHNRHQPEIAPLSTPIETPPPTLRRTILVVEDEPLIGDLWQRVLQREGWTMLWAACGAEALDLFKLHREEIAVLFTDVGLPDFDGWQVVQLIRADAPDLPVIITSGAFKDGGRAPADVKEPVMLLSKPFPPGKLGGHIRELLEGAGR